MGGSPNYTSEGGARAALIGAIGTHYSNETNVSGLFSKSTSELRELLANLDNNVTPMKSLPQTMTGLPVAIHDAEDAS
jgi:hypothetical protein